MILARTLDFSPDLHVRSKWDKATLLCLQLDYNTFEQAFSDGFIWLNLTFDMLVPWKLELDRQQHQNRTASALLISVDSGYAGVTFIDQSQRATISK